MEGGDNILRLCRYFIVRLIVEIGFFFSYSKGQIISKANF